MNRTFVLAAGLLATALAGCSPSPSNDRTADRQSEATASAGGPAGQTPAYQEPGGAPSQVQSQPDASGPSVGESNPPK
jgi:hypothetical protein